MILRYQLLRRLGAQSGPWCTFTQRRRLSRGCKATVARLQRYKADEPFPTVVEGYIRSSQTFKKFYFVSVVDGSSTRPLQAIIPENVAQSLDNGTAVRLVGSWVKSQGSQQSHELQVLRMEVLGPSNSKTFPIQKKYQSPEFLRTIPHVRMRSPFNSALLRLRSKAIEACTTFLGSKDFVQTHPPIITCSDCEGAGEVFAVSASPKTGSHCPSEEAPPAQELPAERSRIDELAKDDDQGPPAVKASGQHEPEHHFFRSPKYLTVSSQLHLEALSQAVGNVWTLSPTFRAERSDTSRHLSEFYMLEAEMSFASNLNDIMRLLEEMLKNLASALYSNQVGEELRLRFIDHSNPDRNLAPGEEVERRWRGMMSIDEWPRITYTHAIQTLQAATRAGNTEFGRAPVWGQPLQTEHEKYISRHFQQQPSERLTPVFVLDYPRHIKAFYMRESATSGGSDGSHRTADCFDLLVPDVCEIAGGSMREHRLPLLLQSMARHRVASSQELEGFWKQIKLDEEQKNLPLGEEKAETPMLAGGNAGDEAGDGAGVETEDRSFPRRDHALAAAKRSKLAWYVDLRRWGCPPHGGFGIGFDRYLAYLSGVGSLRDCVAFPRWHERCDC